ncbi:hypothetical protein F5X71_14255 [Nocardia brasiliensis]|uniref:Uncharacterized protein n=1 Tax=Nocardia brasiliensis TaxID=37326 RepID=A0A6G9XQZ6_NOCBR|nr:hypothetical protein [Nocardia brasiliensis]QIS03326.1 hypothetical protein F5X71_14255 [Nocardia brasiliensis]
MLLWATIVGAALIVLLLLAVTARAMDPQSRAERRRRHDPVPQQQWPHTRHPGARR